MSQLPDSFAPFKVGDIVRLVKPIDDLALHPGGHRYLRAGDDIIVDIVEHHCGEWVVGWRVPASNVAANVFFGSDYQGLPASYFGLAGADTDATRGDCTCPTLKDGHWPGCPYVTS